MARNVPGTVAPQGRVGQLPGRKGGGFSLVELVVVIVVTGIIASSIGIFIAGPIQAYVDQARRGGLVDAAQLALLRMDRDLRAALPNSVRVSGGAIELLQTLDGDRYRSEAPGTAADRLEFTGPDTSFNTLARLDASLASGALRLAVYPLGPTVPGADPYSSAALSPAGVTIGGSVTVGAATEYRVTMPAHRFPQPSPSRRVFLVDGPVTYLCDSRELRRYSGYGVTGAQAVPPTGGTVATIVGDVESCSFSYAAGTAARNAVVALAITLESRDERVRLRRQVQVDNSP